MTGRLRMSGVMLRLDDVSVSFGDLKALDRIDLDVRRDEFVAIVGPSGCGKTTLLNVCAGWLRPDRGHVQRPPALRMVFQQDGLFPWLTVDENISLGVGRGVGQDVGRRRVEALLDLVGLRAFAGAYPHQLSGGMRQGAEIARAFAGEAPLLLMDEPYSSLDYLARLRMRDELARILQEHARTVLFVTHDLEEAAQLADRILVLTDRPARLRFELTMSAPRPRHATLPEVRRAVHQILAVLGLHAERSITPHVTPLTVERRAVNER